MVFQNKGKENLFNFKGIIKGGRVLEEKVIMVWFACVWTIRKTRSNVIFQNKEFEVEINCRKIKLLLGIV